ncbi:hypothetical protein DXN04_30310 [Chitinophaga silvisoli]|uniref:Uncharacterized protein n=1 Tax=Chitinophaga silvisoli TaxID=2291814 RepID=A0A3E1NT74_9BACT|nr:hypothetical protein DXN04_30310 [Chitinophaga silvisoli]
MHFYILLGALWLYPIIILLFFVFTKKRIPARKKVFYLHVSMEDFKTKQMVYWADTIRFAN